MLGFDLSKEVVGIARSGHRAAVMNSGRRPSELVRTGIAVCGEPGPAYAPPPGHQDHPDDRHDDGDNRRREGDEPAPLQTAPFAPGDRVLYRRDPRAAFLVDRCEADPSGGFYVWYDGGSGIAADRLVRAPAGFENAPDTPLGCGQVGVLSEAERQAAQATDAADPGHRAEMLLWHRQTITWISKWWRLVGPDEAEKAILFHRAGLAEMGECA